MTSVRPATPSDPVVEPLTGPLVDLLARRYRGVLATIKRNGRPQLSTVDYLYDPATRLARMSVTAGRAKVANVRRDPRASLYAATEGMGAYVVAEGAVTLSDVAREPDDPAVTELVEVYRGIRGAHPDWAEYRAAMVADARLVLRIEVDRVYGWSPG